MVLLQGYIEEPVGQDSFVVQPPSAYKQKAFRRSSIGSTASFHSSQTSSLDTIQEHSRKLHRTNPDIVSPSQLSMDVFGENLDSLDVWAEEDVFHSTRKHRWDSGRHSQFWGHVYYTLAVHVEQCKLQTHRFTRIWVQRWPLYKRILHEKLEDRLGKLPIKHIRTEWVCTRVQESVERHTIRWNALQHNTTSCNLIPTETLCSPYIVVKGRLQLEYLQRP